MYADQVTEQYCNMTDEEEEIEAIDLSTSGMKCIGATCTCTCKRLVKHLEYLRDNPSIINNGFQAAQIPQSIDAGKPIFEDMTYSNSDSEEVTDDSSYENVLL